MSAPLEVRASVREVVDFVIRRGDLAGSGLFQAADRAVEGTRIHRRIQKSRGDSYRAEITVEREFARENVKARLTGRVDGIIESASPPVVEEIKSVDARWDGAPHVLHLAQLRIYAALLSDQNSWSEAELRLTYVDIETNLETDFRERVTREALSQFLKETIDAWLDWLIPHAARIHQRDESISNLAFPFANYRPGQREMARLVYQTIRDKRLLFLEAPTGLGKTLATLYPAIRALPLLGDGHIFFATAKTPGRHAAEAAIQHLRASGAKIHGTTLTAKDKICFAEPGTRCDPHTCPYAQGYYDKLKPALRELLQIENANRQAIEDVARRHQVCPFELSLDVSSWSDVVICDFNHVFDPTAQLQRHFAEGPARHVVLVDEAHNLVDRSREMHSATLSTADLEIAASASKGRDAARSRKALRELRLHLQEFLQNISAENSTLPQRSYHDGALAFSELPEEFTIPMRRASGVIEDYLAGQFPGTDLSVWLAPLFAISAFTRAADGFDETCRLLVHPAEESVKIFCADPSRRLEEEHKRVRATVFFSATLSPMDYFQDLLGGGEQSRVASYDSPFAPEQMDLRILDEDVSYKGRAASLEAVTDAVISHVVARAGNHLIFCPSMEYLSMLREELRKSDLKDRLFHQTTSMTDADRDGFLANFSTGGDAVGLAVLGGIFSEGIDLPGERLMGVTVIGVGLPRLSLERDVLQDHFTRTRGNGFDYAYLYPGMQRVLQAVGRLIRTETDHGNVLLIDRRYLERRHRILFPSWWKVSN